MIVLIAPLVSVICFSSQADSPPYHLLILAENRRDDEGVIEIRSVQPLAKGSELSIVPAPIRTGDDLHVGGPLVNVPFKEEVAVIRLVPGRYLLLSGCIKQNGEVFLFKYVTKELSRKSVFTVEAGKKLVIEVVPNLTPEKIGQKQASGEIEKGANCGMQRGHQDITQIRNASD